MFKNCVMSLLVDNRQIEVADVVYMTKKFCNFAAAFSTFSQHGLCVTTHQFQMLW